MAKPSDYRVEFSWWSHRKYRRLRRELGAAGVLGIMRLWGFAGIMRPNGELQGMTAQDIAEESEYDGDAEEFVACLVRVGLLDVGKDCYKLHDWQIHQEHVAKYGRSEKEKSEQASLAAKARWEKEKSKKANAEQCESMNPQCGTMREHESAMRSDADAYTRNAVAMRNMPSYLPTILPSDPTILPTRTVHSRSRSGELTPTVHDLPAADPSGHAPAQKKPSSETKHLAIGAATWESYAKAYEEKYSIKPPRNHKVNSLMKQLVTLLGAADAPQVAASYLESRDALYVRSKHAPELLVRDAQKLHTEWVTGRHGTMDEARTEDRRARVYQDVKDLCAEYDAEEQAQCQNEKPSPKQLR